MKSLITTIPLTMLVFMMSSHGFKDGSGHVGYTAPQSDTLDIGKFKGKIVVLHFWASWSKASRGENKNLVRVYQVYRLHPKVVFASVSLDTDESAWKRAISEDELTWKNHYCDFKKYESPMAKRHGVNTLPRFLVFNAAGREVSSSANNHDLESVIQAQLQ